VSRKKFENRLSALERTGVPCERLFRPGSRNASVLDRLVVYDDTSAPVKPLRVPRLPIVSLIIVCSMIAACTRKRAWTGPQFSGRLLVMAQDWDLHSDLIEITPGSDSNYNQSIIIRDVFYATASPDQTRLLYSTRDGLFVRELRSGDVEQIVPAAGGTNRCLAWSPDGKRFSFRSSESHQRTAKATLSVADLDDHVRVIWESWVGGVHSDCDVFWIGPDRLIFDRVRGHSPEQEKAGDVLLANTTTIATLSDPVKFADTKKTWSIDGVCQFGNAAVIRPQYKENPVSMAKDLSDLQHLKPAQVCPDCKFAGFAAKSCLPYFMGLNFENGSDIFSLNPTNWQRQKTVHINQAFSVTARTIINTSARLMVVGSGDRLFLVDAESGDVAPFFPRSFSSILNKRIISVEPVTWIEN
jgi:hypothetical protein